MEDLGMSIIMIVIFLVILLFLFGVKKAETGHFDERQEIARGKAYKYGFTVMMTFLIVYFLYDVTLPNSWIRLDTEVLGFGAIILGLSVFVATAVWNEAYTYVEQTPHNLGWGISYIVLAVIAILAVLSEVPWNCNYIENGKVVYQNFYTQLGMFIVWCVIGGTYMARTIVNRAEGEEEE